VLQACNELPHPPRRPEPQMGAVVLLQVEDAPLSVRLRFGDDGRDLRLRDLLVLLVLGSTVSSLSQLYTDWLGEHLPFE
jgi:hypothetical protein